MGQPACLSPLSLQRMDAYENHVIVRRIAMTWQERAFGKCRVILASSTYATILPSLRVEVNR